MFQPQAGRVNAHCLQAYAQELKLRGDDQLEPGEQQEPMQEESSILEQSTLYDSVKRRRASNQAVRETTVSTLNGKSKKGRRTTKNKQPSKKPRRKLPVKRPNQSKGKHSKAKPIEAAPPKQEERQATIDAQEKAKKAANMAEQLMEEDPGKTKALLQKMALVWESPRSAPNTWPPKNSVIPKKFVWVHYPPLEAVLTENMKNFYSLSLHESQTAGQVKFNDGLVQLIKQAAQTHGLTFDSYWTDKLLRDRIRCYYKTHTMNAKKRLLTMIANPTGPSNTRRLSAVLELLEEIQKDYDTGDQKEKASPAVGAYTATEPIEKTSTLLASESALSSVAARRMSRKGTVTKLCEWNSIL
ncbi:unnamed protein product [Cylindrotheca closterium]|uniref:Uncharacterized protein n=1 Tax=Cylindrotheca closterium TaxID=2856 RepID=A0AAD2CJK6_9STRA|nr:unnamed protein product [Cylindrotheca closterium]